MIDPGKLDTPIEIQEATVAKDAMGAPVTTWAQVPGSPTWGQYLPLRGQERIMAGQLKAVTEFKLRTRRDANVTPSCIVAVDNVDHEILGIEDNRRDGDMVLHCKGIK